MRKVLSKLALAAAALAGASTSANAFVIVTLTDTGPGLGGAKACNTFDPVTAANCGAGFTIIDANTVAFNGTVGNFSVILSSTSSNNPGDANEAFVTQSTNRVTNNNTVLDTFEINTRSFGFVLPAGDYKTFRGSASQSSTNFSAGDMIENIFVVDANNGIPPLDTTTIGCDLTINSSSQCDAAAVVWFDDPAGTPGFSIRDVQKFTMAAGNRTTNTSTATVGSVPEPMTTSLVGAALLGLALASRRKGKAA